MQFLIIEDLIECNFPSTVGYVAHEMNGKANMSS